MHISELQMQYKLWRSQFRQTETASLAPVLSALIYRARRTQRCSCWALIRALQWLADEKSEQDEGRGDVLCVNRFCRATLNTRDEAVSVWSSWVCESVTRIEKRTQVMEKVCVKLEEEVSVTRRALRFCKAPLTHDVLNAILLVSARQVWLLLFIIFRIMKNMNIVRLGQALFTFAGQCNNNTLTMT